MQAAAEALRRGGLAGQPRADRAPARCCGTAAPAAAPAWGGRGRGPAVAAAARRTAEALGPSCSGRPGAPGRPLHAGQRRWTVGVLSPSRKATATGKWHGARVATSAAGPGEASPTGSSTGSSSRGDGYKAPTVQRLCSIRLGGPDGDDSIDGSASAADPRPTTLTIDIAPSMRAVGADEWDVCAGSANPFVAHAFLSALEESGSVGARTGWRPMHMLAREAAGGALVGALPLYLKAHSYGEYVFDQSWANFYQRHGAPYYPKLQSCVPFSPTPGPRLLARPAGGADAGAGAGPDPAAVKAALAKALVALTDQLGASSTHLTFHDESDAPALAAAGFLPRTGVQYHWGNRPGTPYRDFDDFLGDLKQSRRKSIRQERKALAASGLTVRRLTGPAIEPRHWRAFYAFYRDTADKKGGIAYLRPEFFDLLGATMSERVLLVVAETPAGEVVAGALNLIGGDTLYGRNWGCLSEYRYLHFNLCYYEGIDWAIGRGFARVEAGAQGDETKLSRGYLPARTYSSHYLRETDFRNAVGNFLVNETAAMEEAMKQLGAASPFKPPAGPGQEPAQRQAPPAAAAAASAARAGAGEGETLEGGAAEED